MNTILATVAYTFFGPKIGHVILCLVVAPIIEESAKRFAVVEKYPWVYTGIFAGLEMLQYVIGIVASGGIFAAALIIRISALMMHFATTYIQKYFREKGETERSKGIENNLEMIGYFLAIGVHFTWNLVGLIFNKQISTFAGLPTN